MADMSAVDHLAEAGRLLAVANATESIDTADAVVRLANLHVLQAHVQATLQVSESLDRLETAIGAVLRLGRSL